MEVEVLRKKARFTNLVQQQKSINNRFNNIEEWRMEEGWSMRRTLLAVFAIATAAAKKQPHILMIVADE